MRLSIPFVFAALLLPLAGCGSKPTSLDEFSLRPVTLPNGQKIQVETMIDNVELLRGMMFRTSLAPDRGMLFVYPKPARYQIFMYQTLIPLDIVWMDANRGIVAMNENVPPCKTQASHCPRYGDATSSYALEIPAGSARKYNLQLGQTLQW